MDASRNYTSVCARLHLNGAQWLSVDEFAALARISARKARQALKRAHEGATWRNTSIVVQTVHGRGGRSGCRYEVRSDSLPASIRPTEPEATANLPAVVEAVGLPVVPMIQVGAKMPVPKHHGDFEWKERIIAPALRHPKGSPERKAAIEAIAATATYPDGAKRGRPIAKSTLYLWLDRRAENGMTANARKVRSDKLEPRVVVSQQWDRKADELGIAKEQWPVIQKQISRVIATLYQTRAPSANLIQDLARPPLMELTRPLAPDLCAEELSAMCTLPESRIEKLSHNKAVYTYRKDKLKSYDTQKPAIHRHVLNLRPMQWVAGDVTPSDILMAEGLGKLYHIAFYDLHNNRLFKRVIHKEKGAPTSAEVAEVAIEMFCHPDWGIPDHLYLDNGSEFHWADVTKVLSKLKHKIMINSWSDLDGFSGVTRSIPGNPQGKAIEGVFSTFARRYLPLMEGFVGIDRLKKRTERKGKDPRGYTKGPEKYKQEIQGLVDRYNGTPQNTSNSKLSPNERYRMAVEAGHRSMILNSDEAKYAFTDSYNIYIRAGGDFYVNKTIFRHDDLLLFAGQSKSFVAEIPKFGDRNQAFVYNEDGDYVCTALPINRYGHGDQAGAIESSRMAGVLRGQIIDIEAEQVPLDPLELVQAANSLQIPTPTTPVDVVTIDEKTRKAALVAKALPPCIPKPSKSTYEILREMNMKAAS